MTICYTRRAFPCDNCYLLSVKSVSASAAGQDELWRVPVSGGEPQKVGLAMETLRFPNVHPDGRKIAFDTGAAANHEVWVLENFLPAMTASR